MGRQIALALTTEDTRRLGEALGAVLELALLEHDSPTRAVRRRETIEVSRMGKEDLLIHLARPADLKQVKLTQLERDPPWEIDSLVSPVVELSRCYHRGRVLRVGRMYFNTGFYDRDERWIEKPAPFLAWAKRVFLLTRKVCKRDPKSGTYLGAEAAALLAARRLDLHYQ
jgi:hypothetical protein